MGIPKWRCVLGLRRLGFAMLNDDLWDDELIKICCAEAKHGFWSLRWSCIYVLPSRYPALVFIWNGFVHDLYVVCLVH